MNNSKKIVLFLTLLGIFSCVYFFRFKDNESSIQNKKTVLLKDITSLHPKNIKSNKKYHDINHSKKINTQKTKLTFREKYEAFLNKHPFNNRPHINKEEDKEEDGENETDRPDLAWEQDYLRTMDPALKRPTPEVLGNIIKENLIQKSKQVVANSIPGTTTTPWVERGPNNVGGRTRALVWDPNDATGKKVWAGGVTGGLWFNSDITDANSSWNRVDDFWSNISVSCIAFDPNNSQIAYVGTGEGFTASSLGAGIWKTVNGGTSWSQLSSTTTFSYSNDLVVRNESGTSVVYAAIDGQFYNGVFHNSASAGLQRSVNGGSSWTQVLPTIPGNGTSTVNFVASSIAISASNRIWIGTKQSPYGLTDRGGGYVFYSDNGTTWVQSNQAAVTNGTGRVTVACAPSDNNYIYSFTESSRKLFDIRKTINAGTTWTSLSFPRDADNGIPTSDFTRGQGSYNQVLEVDPNNAQTLIIGGIDLFRSTDTGTTWKQISKWSNNNNLSALKSSLVHADQHIMTFAKGSSTTAIFGNDGGVFYTTELQKSDTSNVIQSRNKNYNVTQFYSTAIHPAINSNNYLAGAQDNGTQLFSTAGINSTTVVFGGDGGYCFIDQNQPNFMIVSYVYNQFYLSTNGGITTGTLLSDDSTGSFINPACYDNNLGLLYSYKGIGSLYRVIAKTIPRTASTINISALTSAVTALKVSPFTLDSTTLFIGTNAGKILKVTKADTNPNTIDITGNLPVGSISNIELGANENEILVTFFNYGINKIWYSSTGGNTWINKSGNFPNIPARWGLFNPNNRTNEVILATELGIYGTTNFSNTSPTWVQSNNGFANVRTDMLQMRNSDFQVVAATFGRGLFTSNGFVPSGVLAPTITSFTPTSSSSGAIITITGTNFTGATAVSFGGVNATSFNIVSSTSITAVVGSGKSGLVSVTTPGGNAVSAGNFTFTNNSSCITPIITNNRPLTFCIGDSTILTSSVSTGNQWQLNGTLIASATANTLTIKDGGSYTVITSNGTCTSAASLITVNALPTKPIINWNSSQLSTASGLTSYQWLLGGINVAGATNNTYTPASIGNYTVRVSNTSGCINLSDPYNLIVTAITPISISGTSVKVYPNPTSTEAMIVFDQTPITSVQIKLINSYGNVVKSILTKQKVNKFSVFDLSKGIYYVEFTNGKQKGTIQLMIQ